MSKKLHIISFDVPYPADYGGAIDVFYRIKALAQLGVEITLHCFEYGRGQQLELNQYCKTVIYYKRKKSLTDILVNEPFIVKTRKSKKLLNNLLQDDAPILFEGLHTTGYIKHPSLAKRVKLVRAHNIEHHYYEGLANQATGAKKKFFAIESKKLKTYEPILSHATAIFAIKESDCVHFNQYCRNVLLLTACTDKLELDNSANTAPFSLFHGNLSVPENEDAVFWLVNNVFSENSVGRFKIAGKNPSDKITSLCITAGVELIPNPTETEMNELKQNARIHVFYSKLNTGVKLKLLHSLGSNGHIIVNDNMVDNLLRPYVHIANSSEDYQNCISELLQTELDFNEKRKRSDLFENELNTVKNCQQILSFL